ncbi:MAG: hypothetical protein KA746_16165 [Pyrinomonadaceae bacterium]|nr:hypothetical protein [Pyrinomonadaceae bacterium]MBP6214255.1 hypothetical protein [Pyrinomonadaceae bacterium]
MKLFQPAAMFVIAIAIFTGTANAQKKPVKKPTTKKPPATKTVVPPLDVRAAREKVDVQLSNVNDFEKKLALIAQGLEVADADAKAGRLKPETAAKITAKKAEIVDAIRNIRVGLGNLESEFRTKPVLAKYLPSIQGITDLSAEAEDFAIAGKFVDSKTPLRSIAQKLTDTLAVLPR